ncbi:MAG: hypothetical protein G01um101491_72 [Parcubacteria group bacterium Gr01-1014_91]|nr:MAG: hypothetical protein G01um101491_72 [Parcubacteria group bacterium Gr01-1014_91]
MVRNSRITKACGVRLPWEDDRRVYAGTRKDGVVMVALTRKLKLTNPRVRVKRTKTPWLPIDQFRRCGRIITQIPMTRDTACALRDVLTRLLRPD